jgi:putative restriction endonuclease
VGGFKFDSKGFDHGGTDLDAAMRAAAFDEIHRLTEINDILTSEQLRAGFLFRGERIPFINPQRGIFKPRQMAHLLSIKTVVPKKGGRIWYEDQRRVHSQIYSGDETVAYSFMGDDPDAADNRWLKDAMAHQTPIIYFLGTTPGRYQPLTPTFVVEFNAKALEVRIAFGTSAVATAAPQSVHDRRYAVRLVKQRLHQATFRDLVIGAYEGRCAISGLPEPRLLDAAHIIEDRNELLGQPIVTNGIPLSKIHHAAFDAHLIGISPDYKVHVSDRLLAMKDGPTLEALRQFDKQPLRSPKREADRPDPDRLAARFELFTKAA